MADAETRKRDGDFCLSSLIYASGQKSLREMISTAWMMKNSISKVANLNMPRMDAVAAAAQRECVNKCGGQWLTLALDVLQKNHVDKFEYAEAETPFVGTW